jgi:hypothetical protein
MKKTIFNITGLLIAMAVSLTSCIKEDYFGKSDYNRIITFSLPLQLNAATINHDSLLIRVAVSDESDLRALKPAEIRISNFATLTPGVEEIRDFSDPVVYTVTAEDGTKAAYTVIVTTDAPRQ